MTTTTSTESGQIQNTASEWKDNTLKMGGVSYLLADAAMGASRIMEKDWWGLAGVGWWAIGSGVAALFANPKAEKQLQLIEHRLGNYLKKQGVEIPKNPTTAELTKEGGVMDHLTTFLYTYPSQVLNAVYAIGAASILRGGFKKGVKSDVAVGAFVLAGGLAGLLIPEKKPDPDHRAQGAMGKAWEWIQEKPLRLTGGLYFLNNVANASSIYEKWQTNVKAPVRTFATYSHYPRFVSVAFFVFANTMLTLSSKGHGGGNKTNEKVMSKLAEESAMIIAAQPRQVQDAMIQQVAGYLASQPEIQKTAPEIANLLHTKLAAVQQAAPALAGDWRQRLQAPPETPAPAL